MSEPPASAAKNGRSRPTLSVLAGEPLRSLNGVCSLLPDALAATARAVPNRGIWTYRRDGSRRFLSYPGLETRARRLAGGLLTAGVRAGEIVLVHEDDLEGCLECLWGCMLIGAWPVILAAAEVYDRRTPILDKTFAAWRTAGRPPILASTGSVAAIEQSLQELYQADGARVLAWDSLSAGQTRAGALLTSALPEAPALLQASAGSTGTAKLIQITHQGVMAFVEGCRLKTGFTGTDPTVNWLPLDHVGALLMFHLRDVVLGANQVHLPTASVIENPLRWVDALVEHRATHTWSPNFGYALLADAISASGRRDWDLAEVSFFNGGEQCTEQAMQRFLSATSPLGVTAEHIWLMWGMAETCTAMTYRRLSEPGLVRSPTGSETTFMCVGAPAAGTEVRILDADGSVQPSGVVGQLNVRSIRVTPGYLGGAQPNIDSDGWLDTGDLAFVEDGELAITGRSAEMVVVNGANVPSHVIEQVMCALPGILDRHAAACGFVDPVTGAEAFVVFFVVEPDAGIGPDSLRASIVGALVYEVGAAPADVVPVAPSEWPTTSSGKIQRTRLRDRWLAGRMHSNTEAAPMRLTYEPLGPPRRESPTEGTLVVVGHDRGSEIALVGALRDEFAGPVILVSASDLARAPVDTVLATEPAPTVLFLGGYQEPDPDACARRYLRCVQALVRAQFRGPLVSASVEALTVAGTEAGAPGPAVLPSLAASTRCERPEIDAWHADLSGVESAGHATQLANLAAVRGLEHELAHRYGRPLAPALVPADPEQPPSSSSSFDHQPGSFHVAIGGLSSIAGEVLTTILPAQSRLLVTGRGGLDGPSPDADRRRRQLRHLKNHCAEVRYVACPAEDGDALITAVDETVQLWDAPVSGVSHFAGVYEPQLIEQLDDTTWRHASAAKIAGAIAAVRLAERFPHCSVFALSSVFSHLPAPGSAAYGAANRFLQEYLARFTGTTGAVRAVCLSLGRWDGPGMSAALADSDDALQLLYKHGLRSVSPDRGVAIAGALARGHHGTWVLGLDAGAIKPSPTSSPARSPSAAEQTTPSPTASRGTPEPTINVLERLVEGSVETRLAHDTPFSAAGLTSIELIRLRSRISHHFGINLPAVAAFEHPTLQDLAAHVDSLLGSRSSPALRPHTGYRSTRVAEVGIVGVALRVPGATSDASYWANLLEGRSSVRRFSQSELKAAGISQSRIEDPDFVGVGGTLPDIEMFDPARFGMSRREALLTAPQQRLLLEVVAELLEGTGGAGSPERVGVFASTGMNLYALQSYLLQNVIGAVDTSDPITALQVVIGNEPDFAATRIAHRLDLRGPAINVQTACSSSLVAVHLAHRAIVSGDCDTAIVAASAVHLPQLVGYLAREESILSPTGVCRAFDRAADGTVGGNGCVAIRLARLDIDGTNALPVRAVIRSSAVNNDGARKVGFTAPGVRGQQAVIDAALRRADIDSGTVAFVQAHGTGTLIGDPIEVDALTRAFGANRSTRQSRPCRLGSVKPNIGHLDSCSGLAGLVAALLSLEHRTAPPQINYSDPNPELNLGSSPFAISPEPVSLTRTSAPLRVGVSAMGVGGTNAHVILEEPTT